MFEYKITGNISLEKGRCTFFFVLRKGGCSTLSIPYTRMDSTIGGCYQLPVCEENYSMNHDVNGPYCVLHVRQTSTRKVVTPCNGNCMLSFYNNMEITCKYMHNCNL